MKLMVSAILFLVGTQAIANSACDKPKNDFDGLYCLNKIYMQADKELNYSYTSLNALLDVNGKKTLKAKQLIWIKERDDNCSFSDQRGFFVNLECAAHMTKERLQFLNDRKRECESAGCMNSKLE